MEKTRVEKARVEVESLVNQLLEHNVIGKDSIEAARVVLACMMVGANKDRVQKVLGKKSLEPYWTNLQPFFHGEKLLVDRDFWENPTLNIVLLILAAKGLVKIIIK